MPDDTPIPLTPPVPARENESPPVEDARDLQKGPQ
jgi:hypothetical protein